MSDPRANPLAGNPLTTRDDVARAVVDLYEPLIPHTSASGARVRLGSFAAGFEQASAELEGFARPLYGAIPMTVGGDVFPYWDRIADGLAHGSDPTHPDHWGAITRDADQRMVEQAAIGLALAFCPEHTWERLDDVARGHLGGWLHGIFEHEPVENNWQFFRILVALGLERVDAPFDREATQRSLDLIESYRTGDHWYVDGALENVDYYVPMAFQTYGLLYAAANRLGLGDDATAERYRERAVAFADDFQWWSGPDGAAVAMGRSLTYRFATASFWGALAWADVEPTIGWGAAKGLLLRHLRWWTDKAISDRDGVLSVGYAYDNRRLCESYNSAGSPYWAMKAFAALAAPDDHAFWTSDEEPATRSDGPVRIADVDWVVTRDDEQSVALVGRSGFDFALPEQASAKYRKLAYSSAFALAGDCDDFLGRRSTDSMLAVTDDDGNRRTRLGVEDAGSDADLTWSTWRPFANVRVDTVCWFVDGTTAHGRIHRIRNERIVTAVESGYALGFDPDDMAPAALRPGLAPGTAAVTTFDGTSLIHTADPDRTPAVEQLAVNAHLVHPRVAVPVLRTHLEPGDHELSCIVWASRVDDLPDFDVVVPDHVRGVLDRIG